MEPPTTLDRRLHVTRSRARPGGTPVAAGRPFRERKPPWLKVPAPGGPTYRRLKSTIQAENLHTVCEEANCPNVGECWERGTATFMILGDVCTRRCGFCNVKTGKPTWNDPLEPARVARSIARMGLRHAVITSVDRDDLPDYGAGIWAATIRMCRRQAPNCKVEVLTPDFRGQEMPLAKVVAERPDVFNHNVEVVARLYPVARRGSQFLRSCRVLRNAKEMAADEEVSFGDPRAAGRWLAFVDYYCTLSDGYHVATIVRVDLSGRRSDRTPALSASPQPHVRPRVTSLSLARDGAVAWTASPRWRSAIACSGATIASRTPPRRSDATPTLASL